MNGDRSKPDGSHRTRINIHESYELCDWSKHFTPTSERPV